MPFPWNSFLTTYLQPNAPLKTDHYIELHKLSPVPYIISFRAKGNRSFDRWSNIKMTVNRIKQTHTQSKTRKVGVKIE